MVTLLPGVYQSQFEHFTTQLIFHIHLRCRYLQELREEKAAVSVPGKREEAAQDEHPLCLLNQGSERGRRQRSDFAGWFSRRPLFN